MTYSKQTWVDGSNGGTPITAARLGHIEDGIEDAAGGGASDLSEYEGDTISIGASGADGTAVMRGPYVSLQGSSEFGPDAQVHISAEEEGGTVYIAGNAQVRIRATGVDGVIDLEAPVVNLNGTPIGASVSPMATEFTVEEMPDPVRGGDATMSVLVFPANQPVLAYKIEGDEFPRLMMLSNTGDFAVALGDGTADPYSVGSGIYFDGGSGTLSIGGANRVNITRSASVFGDLLVGTGGGQGDGVVVYSPDNTKHRLLVANDGSVTSELVV